VDEILEDFKPQTIEIDFIVAHRVRRHDVDAAAGQFERKIDTIDAPAEEARRHPVERDFHGSPIIAAAARSRQGRRLRTCDCPHLELVYENARTALTPKKIPPLCPALTPLRLIAMSDTLSAAPISDPVSVESPATGDFPLDLRITMMAPGRSSG
jgi:hypothetical protein